MTAAAPVGMSQLLTRLFADNCESARARARTRAENAALSGIPALACLAPSSKLGARQTGDTYVGCARLRALRCLLRRVDENGFERSAHQLRFHDAFEQACARILYKEEFPVHRADICRLNSWDSPSGEVLISTPRRFGKTFAVSQFCACLALSSKQEIVIFSPGRRASRSILVRIQEFVHTVGMGDSMCEYNQEQMRVKNVQGTTSTIRSFPSKVSVRLLTAAHSVCARIYTCACACTHTRHIVCTRTTFGMRTRR